MQCAGKASGWSTLLTLGRPGRVRISSVRLLATTLSVRLARLRCTVGETTATLRGAEIPVKQMSWISFVVCKMVKRPGAWSLIST